MKLVAAAICACFFFSIPVSAVEINPPLLWFACEADSDCVVAPGRCGCMQGGTAVAVNAAYLGTYKAALPAASCPLTISEHWTCKASRVRCQNKECQLVRISPPPENATDLAACEGIADSSSRDACVRQAAARLPSYNQCTMLRENRSRHQCVQAVFDQLDSRKVLRKDDCARVPQVSADFCPTTRDACALTAAPKDGLEVCTEVSCASSFNACVEAAGLPAVGLRREAACLLLRQMHKMRPTFFTPVAGVNAVSPDIRAYIVACGVKLP